MRVVITRPEKKALHTYQRLKEMGLNPILMPLSYFTYDKKSVRRAFQESYAAIAITSNEALTTLPPNINHQKILFAVGKKSALLAQKKGFSSIFHGTSNGIDLAQKIIDKKELFTEKKPLIYLGGNPRSSVFEMSLIRNKIPLKTVNCYHTWNITYHLDDTKKFLKNSDVVLFYSKESVLRFFLLPLPPISARFLCLSARIAGAIPKPYQKMIAIANSPQESSLLKLL
ncbi:uroporphyrinogen-III synthase [Liberibacter sp. Z1]|nr:uroporphyrinogen-III synthase [Candidatus Liberibacter sp.]